MAHLDVVLSESKVSLTDTFDYHLANHFVQYIKNEDYDTESIIMDLKTKWINSTIINGIGKNLNLSNDKTKPLFESLAILFNVNNEYRKM